MKTILSVYYGNLRYVLFLASFLSVNAALLGCGATIVISETDRKSNIERVFETINAERRKIGLPPLKLDAKLTSIAQNRAIEAARRRQAAPDNASLKRIADAGCYVKFALSHETSGTGLQVAGEALTRDPIGKGKMTHPSVTHVGIGFATSFGVVYGVMDLAHLIETVDIPQTHGALLERIDDKRKGNSVDSLKVDKGLERLAIEVAEKFLAGGAKSDDLINEAQQSINSESFSLGRVLVSFQVAGDLNSVTIPERISDPALAYIGLGVAQGNHVDHEPGALVIAVFLAEPQTAHDAKRQLPNLPPPKAVRSYAEVQQKGSLEERAWTATLSGNHRKAAELFEKTYQQTRKPKLLYEAARAHARNEKFDVAIEMMRRYGELVDGAERQKAQRKLAALERGETIFSKSQEQKMSVEAQRFFLIGQRLFSQSEWDGAIDAFQQAYAYSKHPDIIYNIGLAHVQAGRVGEALDYFGEYRRFVPQVSSVDQAKQVFEIGVALYRIGQFEAASQHFTLAYAQLPTPDIIYNLALCHNGMGNKIEAVRLLREFLDTDPPPKDRADAKRMIQQIQK